MVRAENLFQQKYRIPSTRLPWWDYSTNAAYFITICTKDREEVFGEIRNGMMKLNELGKIVATHWQDIPNHFEDVILDEWVVMPNHVHGIIIIDHPFIPPSTPTMGVETIHGGGAIGGVETIHELSLRNAGIPNKNQKSNIFDSKFRRKMIIPKIIGRFKMQTSKEINQMMGNGGGSMWQPNYHDRIIRNERELDYKRRYIQNNPQKWEIDRNKINDNPQKI